MNASLLDIIIPAMLLVYVVTEWIIPSIEALFRPKEVPGGSTIKPTFGRCRRKTQ